MRLLHVIDRFHLGGSEEYATDLAVRLADRGHENFVASARLPDSADAVGRNQKARLRSASISYAELGGRNIRINAIVTSLRLLALIRRFRPDIVHSHTDIPDFIVSLARRLKEFRVARTINNTSLWETRWWSGRICEAAFHDDLVFAVTHDALEAYRALRRRYAFPESPHKFVVLASMPLFPKDAQIERDDFVKRFGADGNKSLLCFAGRLEEQKGLDILLDAMSLLPRPALQRLELHVFGNGSRQNAHEIQAIEQVLPVVFHEPYPDVSRLFSAFDAILVPSRWEGLGRVAVEGFLSGTPVLAADVPGLREALPPNWPLKVPPEDPEALCQLILKFLDDDGELAPLVDRAQSWARETFSPDRETDEYEVIYRNYLDGEALP